MIGFDYECYIKHHRWFEQGLFPNNGTYYDQPRKFISIMQELSEAINVITNR